MNFHSRFREIEIARDMLVGFALRQVIEDYLLLF